MGCNWCSHYGDGTEGPQDIKTLLPLTQPTHSTCQWAPRKVRVSSLQPILRTSRIALCPTYVHSAFWKTFQTWMSESQTLNSCYFTWGVSKECFFASALVKIQRVTNACQVKRKETSRVKTPQSLPPLNQTVLKEHH